MMVQVQETSSPTTVFDTTTVLRVNRQHADRFSVHLDPLWSSLVGIHGGYLVAVAVKAAQATVGDRPIRTVTTNFLRPAQVGAAEVEIDLIRRGRSITNLTVTLSQSSKAVSVSHVTAADAVESTAWETSGEVDLPPIADCVPIAPPPGVGHFDHGVALLDPSDLPFSHGPLARVAGYVRPIESRAIDAPWLAMALDWFPPASFSRIDPPAGGISVSYTVHIHHTLTELGEDEWLGGVFRADVSAGAMALEKGLITDPSGRILAESFHTRWTAGPDQFVVR